MSDLPTVPHLAAVATVAYGLAMLTFESRESLAGVVSDVQRRLGQVSERL